MRLFWLASVLLLACSDPPFPLVTSGSRVARNDAAKAAAKAAGVKPASTKRLVRVSLFLYFFEVFPPFPALTACFPVSQMQPKQPRTGHFVSTKGNEPTIVQPIPFDFLY